MCGIFGWSFRKRCGIADGQREALASTLAIANTDRGTDSWGAYILDKHGKATVLRNTGSIAKLSFAAISKEPLFMGHTRQATTGAATIPNAHPFEVGNLLLAHNGVIYNHSELNKKYDRKCEVDSMHLAMHMAEGKKFDDIEGYGSIQWVDRSKPSKIWLCRMNRGQLACYGVTADPGSKRLLGIVWSSTERHAERALDAAGLHYFQYKDYGEGVLYSVQCGRTGVYTKSEKLLLKDVRVITAGRSYPSSSYSYEPYRRSQDYCYLCEHFHRDGGCTHSECFCQGEASLFAGFGTTPCRYCDHWHKNKKCMWSNCPCTDDKRVEQSPVSSLPTRSLDTPGTSKVGRGEIVYHPGMGELTKIADGQYLTRNGHMVECSDVELADLYRSHEYQGIGMD
jgi:hypothetical protein